MQKTYLIVNKQVKFLTTQYIGTFTSAYILSININYGRIK